MPFYARHALPCSVGRPLLKWPYGGPPAGWAACSRLLPLSTLQAVCLWIRLQRSQSATERDEVHCSKLRTSVLAPKKSSLNPNVGRDEMRSGSDMETNFLIVWHRNLGLTNLKGLKFLFFIAGVFVIAFFSTT
jgi:hypothetical protein